MRLVVLGFLAVVFVTGNESLRAQSFSGIAWDILEKGHTSRHAKERINTVRALGQLPGNPRAVELAEELIVDREPDVRAAAALTLGPLNAVRSIPLLREALKDKNIQVDFAASNALLSFGDSSGYAIYYQVLIGKRKSGEGPVEEQKTADQRPQSDDTDDARHSRRLCALRRLRVDDVSGHLEGLCGPRSRGGRAEISKRRRCSNRGRVDRSGFQ